MRKSTIVVVSSSLLAALAACVKSESSNPAALPSAPTPAAKAPEAKPENGPVASTAEPDSIKVQHVLVAFKDAVGFIGRGPLPPGASGRTKDEAERLAVDVFARAKKGEDFAALVQRYTDDSPPGIYGLTNKGKPARPQYYPREGMARAFGDVGFALKVGEIGMSTYDPDKSPFGWHIIKRIE